MIRDAIKSLPKQLQSNPKIENEDKLQKHENFIVIGMGGSHLAADLIKSYNPSINLIIHQNYGLPALPEIFLRNSLIITSSYSGNTEEVIDAFNYSVKKGLALSAISIGGKLLELAKEHNVPYIQMPDTNIQPRSAVGFSTIATLKLMRQEAAIEKLRESASNLNMEKAEREGQELAKKLSGSIPVIYASNKNASIAMNWKVRFNETGKIAAFYNVFPELNHNETMGFDFIGKTEELSNQFKFIFLKDPNDHPRILIRMDILKDMYKKRGIDVFVYELQGENMWEKIFSSLLLADWTSYYTAVNYRLDTEGEETVESFKRELEKRE